MSTTMLSRTARRTVRARKLPVVSQLTSSWGELYRRQGQLATAAAISLFAIVPCMLAMLVDTRTIHDISVWTKPAKFLFSFVVYYATLAWAFGFVPKEWQSTRAGRFVISGSITVGALEMLWILVAAANGLPSHFNTSSWGWRAAYGFAGLGSVGLISAILVQGLMIARQRSIPVSPALRWALVSGALIAFIATLVAAGYMSAGSGHWVGGEPSDARGLALLGWSRSGGDLRVAHFFALHAQQLIPAIGCLAVAARIRNATSWVALAAALYVALIVFTFAQALQGKPFLAFLG